jgi:hypothetical protein
MTFVNEFTSEEDLRKFRLDELLTEFNPFHWRKGRPSTFKHSWTVDKSRNAYLVCVENIEEVGPSGRDEPTTRYVFAFFLDELKILVTLDKAGSSLSFKDSPFLITYRLIEISCPEDRSIERNNIISALREALVIYGYQGAWRQVENTIVKLDF